MIKPFRSTLIALIILASDQLYPMRVPINPKRRIDIINVNMEFPIHYVAENNQIKLCNEKGIRVTGGGGDINRLELLLNDRSFYTYNEILIYELIHNGHQEIITRPADTFLSSVRVYYHDYMIDPFYIYSNNKQAQTIGPVFMGDIHKRKIDEAFTRSTKVARTEPIGINIFDFLPVHIIQYIFKLLVAEQFNVRISIWDHQQKRAWSKKAPIIHSVWVVNKYFNKMKYKVGIDELKKALNHYNYNLWKKELKWLGGDYSEKYTQFNQSFLKQLKISVNNSSCVQNFYGDKKQSFECMMCNSLFDVNYVDRSQSIIESPLLILVKDKNLTHEKLNLFKKFITQYGANVNRIGGESMNPLRWLLFNVVKLTSDLAQGIQSKQEIGNIKEYKNNIESAIEFILSQEGTKLNGSFSNAQLAKEIKYNNRGELTGLLLAIISNNKRLVNNLIEKGASISESLRYAEKLECYHLSYKDLIQQFVNKYSSSSESSYNLLFNQNNNS